MNPELPQVRPSSETMPHIPGGVEYFPDGTTRSPEVMLAPERQPSQVERAPQSQPVAPAVDASSIAVPQVPAPMAPAAPVVDNTLLGGTPAIAADDDLIEKEWVDKAKKIISLTRGNPYEQAKAIAGLQADYLKKRHNREVGGSNEA